ncbi:MAG: beta-glucosidase BglX [Acidobacteriota bacterium]
MKLLKKPILFIFVLLLSLSTTTFVQDNSFNGKVEELLSMMTLEEKVGQLTQYSGFSSSRAELVRQGKIGSFLNIIGAEDTNKIQKIAVEESRLGIPLIFGLDVIHGYRTIFPIPLAQACSWDPEMVKKAESIAAKEARASGIHWTFAPMVDIARDPRWGRIAEGAGEDPYLGSVMAAARVEGFQGTDLSASNTILSCLKHFVAYGGAEGGRDYNTVDMSEKTLREIYLPPFKAGVEHGALSVMSAFNSLNGIPASANHFTLQKILRQEWGFEGYVVSDWASIEELIIHGYAADQSDAAQKAFQAGVDMDMQGNIYQENLAQLVKDGTISEKEIDDAVRRILKIKFLLGLFDNPYADPEQEATTIMREEHIAFARDMARKSIVLLKNENNLLPLDRNIKSIAVIGPLADNKRDLLGTWSCRGRAEDVVTVLEGIKNKASSQTTITYTKGCDVAGDNTEGFDEAVKIAKKADVAIVVLGESAAMSGEAASRASLDLPGTQTDLLKALYETGAPIVVVLMNGRPLSINWAVEHIPVIIEAWHPGVQGGNAIADVLYSDYNPSGKLAVTFPRSVGQIPIYYNHENTGRPASPDKKYTSKYLDISDTPLFPFGYGLSYTTFEYSNLRISVDRITPEGTITVRADIKNSGDYEGDEVVQLYIRDEVASAIRPVKELKGFTKIHLKPGQKRTVEFSLGHEQLGFYNQQMEYVVEPGVFKVWVGWNSAEGLQGSFEVIEK